MYAAKATVQIRLDLIHASVKTDTSQERIPPHVSVSESQCFVLLSTESLHNISRELSTLGRKKNN